MHESITPPDVHEQQPQQEVEEVAAWEEIAEGRFMPRRVRGSYRGGQLG